jgi:hypothetical protein
LHGSGIGRTLRSDLDYMDLNIGFACSDIKSQCLQEHIPEAVVVACKIEELDPAFDALPVAVVPPITVRLHILC